MSANTTQSPTKAQRKTVLVKRSLQLKYASLMFVCVAGALLLMGIEFYHTLSKLILLDNPSLLPLLQNANSIFFVRAIIFLVITFIASLIVSHRFAGPIYRFEKSAQAVGSGDLTHRVSLRTGDDLLELQEEFNGMVSSLQSMIQKDRNLIQRLSSRLDSVQKQLPESQAAGALRDEILAIRAELEHITASFKV